jgi:hypothetical protein
MIIIKYIGVGLLIILLLLVLLTIYYYINDLKHPQKHISKRRGLHVPDEVIIAPVPINQWTEDSSTRILIYIEEETHTYVYKAHFIKDTYVYKLNEIWLEKESNQETEYSKFIGRVVENYLLTKKNNH